MQGNKRPIYQCRLIVCSTCNDLSKHSKIIFLGKEGPKYCIVIDFPFFWECHAKVTVQSIPCLLLRRFDFSRKQASSKHGKLGTSTRGFRSERETSGNETGVRSCFGRFVMLKKRNKMLGTIFCV